MKKYIIKLQYQDVYLIYSEKLKYFEWLQAKREHLPDNAFLTKEQFNKARNTVLKNLNGFLVFAEEN